MNNRKCRQCGEGLHGRADKKFCDAYCRSQFHNEKATVESSIFRSVERILRRNRRILLMITRKSGMVISKTKLREMGYNFEYFTHRVRARKGMTYYFCYDRGLLPLDESTVAVVAESQTHNDLDRQTG